MRSAAALLAAIVFAMPVAASADGGHIAIELNDLQQADGGCRAVFVVNNGLGVVLDKFGVRVIAFDKTEHARLFLAVDVGGMAISKTRVLRFDLGADIACKDVGRFVLDDVTACAGGDLTPGKCLAALTVSSRAGVDLAL